jgi:ankyrin repeat protein
VNSIDPNGMTVLHYAAIHNNYIGAEKLLSLWETNIDVIKLIYKFLIYLKFN